MSSNLNQGRVIDNLNKYLQWHNLPVRLDVGGICNGLASVYAKYVLEDREEEFLKMLDYVAGKEPSSDIEIEVNHFVVEIALSCIPQNFNKELNQSTSLQAIAIKGKAIKSTFNLALATSVNNWEEIFQSINLQVNEVIKIVGIGHAVSVSKKDGKYRLYDPNCAKGIQEFDTEKALIQSLHCNCFWYEPGATGMAISIFRDPADTSQRDFPKVSDIYTKYLNENNINNQECRSWVGHFGILAEAAIFNDTDAVSKLLELGAKDAKYRAAINAADQNCPDTLRLLLADIKDSNIIIALIFQSLGAGRKETFDELLKKDVCKKIFEKMITGEIKWENPDKTKQHTFDAWNLFDTAVVGGNTKLIETIINAYQQHHGTPPPYRDWVVVRPSMENAILSLSIPTTELLLKLYNEVEPLEDSSWSFLLDEAIGTNNPNMVEFLLEKLPSDAPLKDISMNFKRVQKTDLSILLQLQEKGVKFSKMSNALIDQKKQQPISVVLSIGLGLIRFTDFCKSVLAKMRQNAIINFHIFKNVLTNTKKPKDDSANAVKDNNIKPK